MACRSGAPILAAPHVDIGGEDRHHLAPPGTAGSRVAALDRTPLSVAYDSGMSPRTDGAVHVPCGSGKDDADRMYVPHPGGDGNFFRCSCYC